MGLRPYSKYKYKNFLCLCKEIYNDVCHIASVPDGKPMIGPVPGCPNLLIAAGHEGEGLTLVIFNLSSVPSFLFQKKA